MISNHSLINTIKITFRNKKWLIILSSIVQFILGPVLISLLFTNLYNREYTSEAAYSSILSTINGSFLVFQIIIGMCGGIITGMSNFDYLFSKRMVDLYHSSPIKRTTLFTSININSFIAWFIPAFVSHILCFFLTLPYISFNEYGKVSVTFLFVFLGSLFAFFVSYSTMLVSVMISGNKLNTAFNYYLLGSLVSTMYCVFQSCFANYVPNLDSVTICSENILFLSPIYAIFHLLALYVNNRNSINSALIIFLILGICLIIFNMFLAKWLYQKRKSELAENGTIIKPYILTAKICLSISVGLLASEIFTSMVNSKDLIISTGWGLFGAIMFAFLTLLILDLIYSNGKVRIESKKTDILLCCITAALFMCFKFDVCNLEHFTPPAGLINQIAINTDDLNYQYTTYIPLDENNMYAYDYSNFITVPDKKAAYELIKNSNLSDIYDTTLSEQDSDSLSTASDLDLDDYDYYYSALVTLPFGIKYEKDYPITRKNYTMLENVTQNIVQNQDTLSVLKDKFKNITQIMTFSEGGGPDIYDSKEINTFLENYAKDFDEHYKNPNIYPYVQTATVSISYNPWGDLADENSLKDYTANVELTITQDYTNTIKYLESLSAQPKKNDIDLDKIAYYDNLKDDVINKVKSSLLSSDKTVIIGSDGVNNLSYLGYDLADKSLKNYSSIGIYTRDDDLKCYQIFIDVEEFMGYNCNIYDDSKINEAGELYYDQSIGDYDYVDYDSEDYNEYY